jgi:hypothetical protein
MSIPQNITMKVIASNAIELHPVDFARYPVCLSGIILRTLSSRRVRLMQALIHYFDLVCILHQAPVFVAESAKSQVTEHRLYFVCTYHRY